MPKPRSPPRKSNYDREASVSRRRVSRRAKTARRGPAAAYDLARAKSDALIARRAEELSILRSPINGVVTQMHAALGASVDANQPRVEIADPSALDIVLSVTPDEAGRVEREAKVTLRAGQRATGEPLGTGSVVDISGTVDSATRGVTVRVRAPETLPPAANRRNGVWSNNGWRGGARGSRGAGGGAGAGGRRLQGLRGRSGRH